LNIAEPPLEAWAQVSFNNLVRNNATSCDDEQIGARSELDSIPLHEPAVGLSPAKDG
jgi:hypothetical protein